MSEEQSNGVIESTEKITHSFKLTDQEKIDRGAELTKKNRELDLLDAEFDEKRAKYKKEQKSINLDMRNLFTVIHDGYEKRHVEATKSMDYNTKTVTYTYEGQVLFKRAMNDEERQVKLFPDAKKKAGPLTKAVDNTEPYTDPRDLSADVRDVLRDESNKNKKVSLVD